MTDTSDAPTSWVTTPGSDYPYDNSYELQDNYVEYHRGEMAYANFDWDELEPDVVTKHDTILDASPQELSDMDADGLGDLHRWAMARGLRRHGNLHGFFRVSALILTTPLDARSDEISYSDLRLEYARTLAEAERFDEATAALETYRIEPGSSAIEFARIRGILLLQQGHDDEGLDTLVKALKTHADDEPELALHITEDLLQADLNARAVAFLDRAIDVVRARKDAEQLAELCYIRESCAQSNENP